MRSHEKNLPQKMSLRLPSDLQNLIFAALPVAQVQGWVNNGVVFSDNFYSTLLYIRYGLDKAQINKLYGNRGRLSDYEAYVRAVTLLGDIGYEQHLFADAHYMLINAINHRDPDLVKYYLYRSELIKKKTHEVWGDQDDFKINLCLYYAIESQNVELVSLLITYFLPENLKVIDSRQLLYPFWIDKHHLFDGVEIVKFSQFDYTGMPIEQITAALKNIDTVRLMDLMEQYPQVKDLTSSVRPYINTMFITIKVLDDVKIIKEILLSHFHPSVHVDVYLLFCDTLLNEPLTWSKYIQAEFEKNNRLAMNLFWFAVSVCNYEAVKLVQRFPITNIVTYISEVVYQPDVIVNMIEIHGSGGRYDETEYNPRIQWYSVDRHRLACSAFLAGKAYQMYRAGEKYNPIGLGDLEFEIYSIDNGGWEYFSIKTYEELRHLYPRGILWKLAKITPLNMSMYTLIASYLKFVGKVGFWDISNVIDKRSDEEIALTQDEYLRRIGV